MGYFSRATSFSRIVFIGLLCLYIYLGVVKIPQTIATNFNDLAAHGIGYLVLMIVGILAFPQRKKVKWLFFALLLFSFLIECIQYFLPWRSFSWLDMLANSTGLLIATIFCCIALTFKTGMTTHD